ncbi:Coenzyme F420 hydrogenase/dehydrogenase, beta subunit C-terminal domain [Desulfococcus sp.]|uniref:Coenzyme F420 hydrogenase/dehydrogenase, beta subunit C-terminal domain n=1 Tax=Desulfococcus sp. TaxID=2025834 RepID=UPI003D0BAF3A
MTGKPTIHQSHVSSSVIDTGLCTGCGACVGLCPYLRTHRGATVMLFDCDREDGRCRRYCPRMETDLEHLNQALFDTSHITPELGAFRGLYMTRATDAEIRSRAQHGGTVTALTCLALEQGLIDGWIVAQEEGPMLPKSTTAFSRADILAAAGSKFGNAPAVAEFNRASAEGQGPLGVVATPCQALALAKMRSDPADADAARVARLKLVIGLFCGWTLDWRKLREMVLTAVKGETIRAMDIPPSSHACMQVETDAGRVEIPIDQVNGCVRDCCAYCTDMTAEFADISVGSARSPEGWDVDRHWNQVIVRTTAGEQLLNLAREKGILEFKDVPPENLAKLKSAAMGKKRNGQSNLNRLFETKKALAS